MLTGATGFIGSHIAERLIREGIGLRLWVRRRNTFVAAMEKAGAHIFLDRGSDGKILKESLVGADTIIHCAGATRALNRERYFEANAHLTRRILGKLQDGQKFILMSSLAAAGPSGPDIPLDESAEPRPVSQYGESKLLAEEYVRRWGSENGDNYVILRPGVVYGPREKSLYHYFRWVKTGVLPLLGKGDRQISIIHIDDMVEAIMVAAAKQAAGETYFVAGDLACSLRALGQAIHDAVGGPRPIYLMLPRFVFEAIALLLDAASCFTRKPAVLGRQKVLELKQPGWLCSNRLIQEKLSWQPRVSLQDGIKRTSEWYFAHKWL